MTSHEIFRVAIVQANTELADEDLNSRIATIKRATMALLLPLRLAGRLQFKTVISDQTLWTKVSLQPSGQRSLMEELDGEESDNELTREVSAAVMAIRTANRYLQHLHQNKTVTMNELDRMWVAHIQNTSPGGVFPLQPLEVNGTLGIRVQDAFEEDFELLSEETRTLKPTQESIVVSFRVQHVSRHSARIKVSRGVLKQWGLTRRDQDLVWPISGCGDLSVLDHLFQSLVRGRMVEAEVRGLRAHDGRVRMLRIDGAPLTAQDF